MISLIIFKLESGVSPITKNNILNAIVSRIIQDRIVLLLMLPLFLFFLFGGGGGVVFHCLPL